MSVRAAVIGGGFMGEVHVRAIRAVGGVVAAIASSSPERASEAARRLVVSRVADVAEILADPSIDVVHICTPNASHAEIAHAAIGASKHVICEKPLAVTTRESRELVQAAAERGVVATVPFVYRFHPLVREARARIAGGSVGALTTVQGSYLQDWLLTPDDDNWRVGAAGGPSRAFADIGSHLVDLLEFVAGERIVRLLARTRTVFPSRRTTGRVSTEDLAVLMIELAGGALGTLMVSQVAPGRKNGLVVEFAGAVESLRFAQERPEELWIGRRRGSELLLRNPEELSDEAGRLSTTPAGHPLGYPDAFAGFVGDTYRAILAQGTGASAPEGLPVFADGLRAAELTESVLESHRSGSWVDTT